MRSFKLRVALGLALAMALGACTPAQQGGSETTPTLPGADPVSNLKKGPGVKDKPVAATPPAKKPAADVPTPDAWANRKDLIVGGNVPASAPVPLPPQERFELPNGLTVIVLPDPTAGTVSMHLAIGEAGTDDEPRDERGVADATALMLTKGTKKYSGEQITARVAAAGASIAAETDAESTHVTCDVRATDFAVCADLIAALVITPTFPPAALDAVKHDLMMTARSRHEDPQALATLHVRNLLWGDDAARGSAFTERTLDALTVKQLAAWQKSRYQAGKAVLVITGQINAKAARPLIERGLGTWATTPRTARAAAPSLGKLPAGVRVRLIDRPDASQATIIIARDGLSHASADYHALLVVNDAFGGGEPGARLTKLEKKLKGKLLGARSFIERGRGVGAILISAYSKGVDAPEVMTGLIDAMKSLAKDGLTPGELIDAKVTVAGAYAFGYERPTDTAAAITTAAMHGLDETWIREFPGRIAAVDAARAKAAAAAYFDPTNLVVVIVGRAADIAPALEKQGVKVERMAWTDEITAIDRAFARAPKAADAKRDAEGRKLLEQAIVARGGARFTAIKTVHATGTMKIDAQGRTIDGTYERTLVAPDRQRVDMTIPGKGTARLVISPAVAFVSFEDKLNIVPDKDRPTLDIVLLVDPELVLQLGRDKAMIVQAEDPQTVDGVKYDAVSMHRADGSAAISLLLDRKTHLPYRVYYAIDNQQVFDEYGQYKTEKNGVVMPHLLKTINVVLSVPLTITFDKIELDAVVAPTQFDVPKAK